MRIFLLLAVLLAACVPTAAADSTPPPEDHACCSAGSRLVPEVYAGKDGSRLPTGRMFDTERDEACTWGVHMGELRCMPPILDATDPRFWPADDCTGDRGYTATYAPAAYPEGTSVIHVLGGELHGQTLMRAEEVPGLYYRGPSGMGPCEPFSPSSGFPPPYHRWVKFDASAFQGGEVSP